PGGRRWGPATSCTWPAQAGLHGPPPPVPCADCRPARWWSSSPRLSPVQSGEDPAKPGEGGEYALISIAIPTGVLLEGSLELLRRAGAVELDQEEIGRKLLVEKNGLRIVLVKPADVPAYVDHGSADLGFAGKDQLWESP